MSNVPPKTIRIGDALGRIIQVGPGVVEYVDETGVADVIDLTSCCQAPGRRVVGLRRALDTPPWFQFFGPKPTRLEFISYESLYRELLIPLGRAGWTSLDGC